MKKFVMMAVLAALMAVPAFAAEPQRGGLVGGIYGCCFGVRGAAAYNDGKDVVAMEWVDSILTLHIWAFIKGYQGTTTADLRKAYGSSFF